jgi:hypothetical protein
MAVLELISCSPLCISCKLYFIFCLFVFRTKEEKREGLIALKKRLLKDFKDRGLDPKFKTADHMLRHRFQLFLDFSKKGVPFDLAVQRVIDQEERSNLLLEFERHALSFEDAEARVDRRLAFRLFSPTCLFKAKVAA